MPRPVQRYRIVEALLETQIALSFAWKDINVLPAAQLTPHALVIALAAARRAPVGALLDLRARGFDLAVIDVSPVPFTARPTSGLDAIAYDIWSCGAKRYVIASSAPGSRSPNGTTARRCRLPWRR